MTVPKNGQNQMKTNHCVSSTTNKVLKTKLVLIDTNNPGYKNKGQNARAAPTTAYSVVARNIQLNSLSVNQHLNPIFATFALSRNLILQSVYGERLDLLEYRDFSYILAKPCSLYKKQTLLLQRCLFYLCLVKVCV